MILGHLAIAGLAKLTYFRQENLAMMIFASYGPDILDKPASLLFGLPGRGASHSLLAFTILVIVLGAYWLRINYRPRLFAAATSLWASHLASDFLEWQILLWPFAGSLHLRPKFQVADKLFAYYVKLQYPYQLAVELISILAIIGIALFCFRAWAWHLRPAYQTVDRRNLTRSSSERL